MNPIARHWKLTTLGLSALLLLAACVATGYDDGVGVGYVGGFYEPYGYDYGGWGPGYRVGPPRGGPRGGRGRGGHGAPSIPSGARGGGHGGGGHGR